jgi:hypothetical protein
MLNKTLYHTLKTIFGEVHIHNEDQPCTYSLPAGNQAAAIWGKKKYASVEDWGEVYGVCCPICGDKRYRLYFSHVYSGKTTPKGRKTPIYFPNTLIVCHNERCHISPAFKKYKLRIAESLENTPSIQLTEELSTKVKPFTAYTDQLELPSGSIPLISEKVPGYVLDYLAQRRLDINELVNKYFVRYAPAGIKWMERDKEKELYDDRLLIPIIQSRRLVSWQAREIGNVSNQKYLFHGEAKRNHYLYNMDKALLHDNIVICEGVTDVWRVGDNCVGLFGKSLSLVQLDILKKLWGKGGSAVVVLDCDATKYAERITELCKLHKVFGKGVTMLELKETEGDPDMFTTKDINKLIEDTREKNLGIREEETNYDYSEAQVPIDNDCGAFS